MYTLPSQLDSGRARAKMLEEVYVYFNMPDPAFGIQLVYNKTDYPEVVTVVRMAMLC